MVRRDLLRLLGLTALAPLFLPLRVFATQLRRSQLTRAGSLPILQGATTPTAAQFSILIPNDPNATIFIRHVQSGEEQAPPRITIQQKSYSPWIAYKVFADGLAPGETYSLEVYGQDGALKDSRRFYTLKAATTEVRFIMASCMRDKHVVLQKSMWAAAAQAKPDVLFLLGDNVYVDEYQKDDISEELIWRRYVETRTTLDLYAWPTLVPTLATWDDHDFGHNNSNGSFKAKDVSKEIFRTMYAQDPEFDEIDWGPGVATAFQACGQRFYLMDDRTFRTSRLNIFNQQHWGEEQEDWLFEHLQQASQPCWIFNGSQFFGGYRIGWAFEENHPERFKKVLQQIAQAPVPVIFGSGDVHYSEIMKIESAKLGYQTYEITSSSMHSEAKKPKSGNKRRLASTGEYNFVVVDAKASGANLQMTLASVGAGGKEHFHLSGLKIQK